IAIPRPNAAEGAIDLDGFFALHPRMGALKPLWENSSLAIVHACGSPDQTRSHFDAQDYMETATPGVKSTRDGWLNRYLQASGRRCTGPGCRPLEAAPRGWPPGAAWGRRTSRGGGPRPASGAGGWGTATRPADGTGRGRSGSPFPGRAPRPIFSSPPPTGSTP